nr:immunoglobulin heavy chain junction region [Mus musculus]NSM04197.1 immunoglobulin heavy chain junction region [Mus musculus]NSM04447.1 immunoglobulin heavy chain junction region [Mus musculus]NSM04691.1 immunoglobulin heavy chain junction region [Mus musculus]NSM04824.1 immunoglobulin heavy chain junction region [Mus musculus]
CAREWLLERAMDYW